MLEILMVLVIAANVGTMYALWRFGMDILDRDE